MTAPAASSAHPVFWFAGGGTGGHIYPGLAVAAELRARRPAARCVFFGTPRPIDVQVIPAEGHELVIQPVQTWPGKRLLAWPGFIGAWFDSLHLCRQRLRTDKPVAVLGLGGYAAAPAMKVAHAAAIPVAMHNPDAQPGRANRALARYADRIFCQWEVSTRLFAGQAATTTGCPIRPEFAAASRATGVQRFGLDPARKTLVFTGASQGAANLNNALVALLGDLDRFAATWQAVIVAGPGKDGELRRQLERRPASPAGAPLAVHVLDFTPHMCDLLAAADLVVSRAGASSCAEFTALGLASILLPYPYDPTVHQRYNADVLTAAGAAVRVDDRKDTAGNAAALRPVLLELMTDGSKLAGMSAAARRLGKPDAAALIAEELLRMAGL